MKAEQVNGIDRTKPSVARMYDYYLGGKDNYAVDREAAQQALECVPNGRVLAEENRAFLGRVVRYLTAECGIRQFLDVGSGLPTQENVHQVAQRAAPDARVVYVDNDPMVLCHGRALLAENGNTTVITADLRDPATILDHRDLRRLIDPSQPVAVLMIAILHFITDDEHPYGITGAFRSWMAPGSYLALSHIDRTPELESAARVYDKASSRAVPRRREEVTDFFGDFKLVEPGLVQVPAWRPPGRFGRNVDVPLWGGVARKPDMEATNG